MMPDPTTAVTAVAMVPPDPLAMLGADNNKYGMTMWFRVRVGMGAKAKPLGEWTSCSGLGIGFDSKVVEEGGRSANRRLAPDGVTYKEITLQRAVAASSSKQIREWLAEVVDEWMLNDDGGAPDVGYKGVDMTIELFSAPQYGMLGANSSSIGEWKLRNVYPKAWEGPSLDASSGNIAMEKLTLAYSGWLPVGPRKAGPVIGTRGKYSGEPALLTLTGPGGQALTLQYQPTEIQMDKSSAHQKGEVNDALADPAKISFTFSVRLEGVTAVYGARKQLFEWLDKNVQEKDGSAEQKFERLELRIGTGPARITMYVWLRSVSTTFSRFAVTGDPSRAMFKITVEQVVPDSPKKAGARRKAGTQEKKPASQTDVDRTNARLDRIEDLLRIPRGGRR